MDTLITAFFLALVTNQVVDGLAEPLRQKWPDLDLWFLVYVTWVLGGVLAYLANINLFAELVPSLDPLAGRLLTAVVTGGGSRLLHSIFDRPATTVTASTSDSGTVTATVKASKTTEPGD